MRGTAVLDRPGAPAPAEGAPEHAYAPRAAALAASAASWPAIAPGHAGRTAASTAGLASGFAVATDDPTNATDPLGLFCLGLCSFTEAGHDIEHVADDVTQSSAYTWFNQHLNPAYFALMGYYDEAQAAENGCGLSTEAKYGAEGTLGLVGTGAAAAGIEEAGSAVLGALGVGTTEAMTGAAVEQAITALPPGTGTNVFTVSNTSDLDGLFADLSQGGTPVDSTYPGEMVELPDGTRVGLRPGSTSGGPTIDANISDGSTLKVHVTPWPPVG